MAGSNSQQQAADADLMARTMLAEGGSDAVSQLAVGTTIRNRLQVGGYGNSVGQIVRPSQFEVWANGRAQAIDPNSQAYKNALNVANGVMNGAPDPTGGATHFYSPSGQAALGRNAPSWGTKNKPLANIGGQLYYAPNGPVQNQAPAQQAINDATSQNVGTTPVAKQADDSDDVFKSIGVDTSKFDQPTPKATSVPTTEDDSDDVFKSIGVDTSKFDKPAAKPATQTPAPSAPASTPNPLPTSGGDQSAAVGRGILNGVPVVGPYLLGGVNRLAAGVRSLQNDTKFSDELNNVNAFSNATAANNPGSTTAGQVAGGIVGSAPLMAAAPAAFGMGSLPLGLRAVAGAAGGGVIGGADSAVRGENPLRGAAMGAALGGVAPVAGAAIGAGARAVGNALAPSVPGMDRGVSNILQQGIANSGGFPAVEANAARLGPNAMLPDTSPTMLQMGQELAAKGEGTSRNTLANALDTRGGAAANARLVNDVRDAVGNPPSPQTLTDSILEHRSNIDNANYSAVHAQNVPVDVSPVIDTIDAKLPTATGAQKTALQHIRSELVKTPESVADDGTKIPETYQDNSELVHNLRKDIDATINYGAPGLGVPQSALQKSQGSVKSIRGALDDVLKTQVPGMADADATSSMLAKNAEAVNSGVNMFDSGKTAPTDIDYHAAFNALTPSQQIAQRMGGAGEINRLLGTAANDPAKLRSVMQGADASNPLAAGTFEPGIGWNTNKLATTYGADNANALVNSVDREGVFANTKNAINQGSKTGQILAGKTLVKQQPISEGPNLIPSSASGLALQAGKSMLYNPLVKALLNPNYAKRDSALANALTTSGPDLTNLLTQLKQSGASSAQVAAVANRLSGGTNVGINALLAGTRSNEAPPLTIRKRAQ